MTIKFKVKATLIVLACLSGCVQHSGILKMGPDTYTVSAHAAPAAGGGTGARQKVLTMANRHCMTLEQEILVTNISAQPSSHFPGGTVVINFRCLSKDDPELRRPNYKDAPDIVIENRSE